MEGIHIMKKIALFLLAVFALTAFTSCASDAQGKPTLLEFTDFTPHFNEEYIVLEKSPDEDFIVLNLTDTQLDNKEWDEGKITREILEYTIDELIKKTQPDLITISGDIAWAGHTKAYKMVAECVNAYGIPWAPVWGNHDNEDGIEYVDKIEEMYMKYDNCIYREGEKELGSGNYVVSIEENGTPITAIFMMDTHDHDIYIDENGNEYEGYSKLNDEQKNWYELRAMSMKTLGYKDSAIIMHIPIFAYRTAFVEAFKQDIDPNTITWQDSSNDEYWNEGYEASYGVRYEYGGFPPVEDGVMDILEDIGHTKYMVVGHDHVNNFVINYRGVNLVYGLKTGMGCYWDQRLNGGTVLRITSNGIEELYHEYINVDHIVEAHAE